MFRVHIRNSYTGAEWAVDMADEDDLFSYMSERGMDEDIYEFWLETPDGEQVDWFYDLEEEQEEWPEPRCWSTSEFTGEMANF